MRRRTIIVAALAAGLAMASLALPARRPLVWNVTHSVPTGLYWIGDKDALAVGERAREAESLWTLLARTLPPPWRVEALVLLAFSAYRPRRRAACGRVAGGGAALRPRAPDGGHA